MKRGAGSPDSMRDCEEDRCPSTPEKRRPRAAAACGLSFATTAIRTFWQALHPRIGKTSAFNLAIARMILTTVALMEIPASKEALLLGHSTNPVTGPCTGLPEWTGLRMWGTMNLENIAGWELTAMTAALYFGFFGCLTNVSLGASGILFSRFYAASPAMGFKIGHPVSWLGPLLLIMASCPAGNALSVDSAMWWGYVTALRRKAAGLQPKRTLDLLDITRGSSGSLKYVLTGMRQSCQVESYLYGVSFALMAIFMGLTFMSAGYQKAIVGTTPFYSWAFSDVMLFEMRAGWFKHMGRPYIPTLAQAGWNPFRVVFHSFLLPVIRIDAFPILLHVGSEVVMLWECSHLFLLLASPPVRYTAIAMDIFFHLGVSWFIGIPLFMGSATVHLMFLPWDRILPWASRWLLSQLPLTTTRKKWLYSGSPLGLPLVERGLKDDDDEDGSSISDVSAGASSGSLASMFPSPTSTTAAKQPRMRHLATGGRSSSSILTCLALSGAVIFFQAIHTFRSAPMDCQPFDAYPGFGVAKTAHRVWNSQEVYWGRPSSLTRARSMLVTYHNGTTLETPILSLMCELNQLSPCILSADLWLHNRNHRDAYRAFKQGVLWPFLSAKAQSAPTRDQYWRLVALITASPFVLKDRKHIAQVSFVSYYRTKVDFDSPWEDNMKDMPTCELKVRPQLGMSIPSSIIPELCRGQTLYVSSVIDFTAKDWCSNIPPVLNPVRKEVCNDEPARIAAIQADEAAAGQYHEA